MKFLFTEKNCNLLPHIWIEWLTGAFSSQDMCFSLNIRKSSCVNARSTPTAAYQVLHLFPEVGYPPPSQDGGGYPRWGTPSRGTPQPGLMGVPKVGYCPSRGYPQQGYPRAGSGWGTSPAGPAWGTPWVWTERLMDGWTDTCENITFPSYCVRGR